MATLDRLPTEILFNILSFASPFDPILVPRHPLYTLAATNRHFRGVVEEYTRVLLKQYANFTIPKKSKIFASRKKWLKWLDSTCQLCKKKSVRKAILDPTLTCCMGCDRDNFPKMVVAMHIEQTLITDDMMQSMHTALTKHGLTKLDLFTPNALHPNLPSLTVGVYMCNGGNTTMISESDVLARKELIHTMLIDSTPKSWTSRNNRHLILINHMNPTILRRSSSWVRMRSGMVRNDHRLESMRTPEGREKFVRAELKKEWALMGIKGTSLDDAINVV